MHTHIRTLFPSRQEEAAAAGKPKIKKPAGKNAGKANELKELEAQLKAMELAKKQKEEKRKAAAAATKVGLGWVGIGLLRLLDCILNDLHSFIFMCIHLHSPPHFFTLHQAAKKKAAAGSDDDYSSEDDLPPLEANPNRVMADVEQARSMEAAIDLLGGSECGCVCVVWGAGGMVMMIAATGWFGFNV